MATIIGYLTYRPTDLDSGCSVQTSDSRGPLSLTVNDDRKTSNKPSTQFNSLNNNVDYGGENIALELPTKPSLLRENGSRSEPRPRSIIVID